MTSKTTILFFAEAVTLAHVARSVVLAKSLDPDQFDVHFAHCPRYRSLLGELGFAEHRIESIPSEQFMAALDQGQPLYDLPTLSRYVEEDLGLIDKVKPDIVVGDFRLSLAVSAELAAVPYITITNACWSPYVRQRYIVPELPLTRALGPGAAQVVFTVARPIVFGLHCRPMNRLRRKFGLKSLGFDLSEVYTHADYTLYADLPGIYQMDGLPDNHEFIGPVIWSPAIPLPDWWSTLPEDTPVIYVALGSSGQDYLLPRVVEALAELPVIALVSTVGAEFPGKVPDNVYWDKYLPGEAAVEKASLVICNGGSPTTNQALLHAVPVIGLAGNLDQYLNMAAIERAGAGRLLRAGTATAAQLAVAIPALLEDSGAAEAARGLAGQIEIHDSCRQFSGVVHGIMGKLAGQRDDRSVQGAARD